MTETYTLLNGTKMPTIGFGTYKLHGQEAVEMTVRAIDAGYRLFDTASMYENEQEIGEGIRYAIKEKGYTREELFVVTKIWKTDMGYGPTKQAFEKSFRALGLEYVDLVLIHWPGETQALNLDTWKALEDLYQQDGRIKAIGVSNFSETDLTHLFTYGTIKPMVNQFSSYPGNSNQALLEFCQQEHVVSMAYSPINRGQVDSLPVLNKVAQTYQKTPAQIALRFAIERGIVPIPKTSNKGRLKENIDVWDFSLTKDELDSLLSLG